MEDKIVKSMTILSIALVLALIIVTSLQWEKWTPAKATPTTSLYVDSEGKLWNITKTPSGYEKRRYCSNYLFAKCSKDEVYYLKTWEEK